MLGLVLLTIGAVAQQSKSALFIGNSYTAYNNLPGLTANLALSLGDTLTTDSNTPGGQTLLGHSTTGASINKISTRPWDYVILQEQSQIPAFGDAYYYSDMYPGGKRLDSLIHANDTCTQTLFYMTWGRKNGDAGNCGAIPDLCTYDGMQNRLRNRYLQIADTLGAAVAPVGMVWRHLRANFPLLELYNPDESHPSLAGSYAAACTFYAAMFHQSPVGASYTGGLSSTDAANIQQAAASIVFDSLATWMIDTATVKADFAAATDSNGLVSLSNNSTANYYWWLLTDSITSTDANPSFIYTGTDSIIDITLIAIKGCQADTATQSLRVLFEQAPDTVSAISAISANTIRIYPNPSNGVFTIEAAQGTLQLYNLQGQLLLSEEIVGPHHQTNLQHPANGTYQLVTTHQGIVTGRQKISIIQ